MPRERLRIASGGSWEDAAGYSRAVRVGSRVVVAGTCARPPYARLGSADEAYRQAKQALEIVGQALEAAGARIEDVIRTRVYVTDIARDARAVSRAHAEVFAAVRPAATMVEVARLIDGQMLVEIEVEAVVGEDGQ